MPPNLPSNAHGFAMRSMSIRDMQITKSQKKILGPPPPKSWGRPCICSGVSRILFREVGHIIFEKWGVITWLSRLLGGSGAYAPRDFFLNSAVWSIFCKNVVKKGQNYLFFYIKIVDILVYCALYLGVLEHIPQKIFFKLFNLHVV